MSSKHTTRIILLILSLILAIPQLQGETQRRAMTIDDMLNMVKIDNAQISPNGQWVFYSKAELDWEKNKYEKKYYLTAFSGGKPYQFIGDSGGSSFLFSPDGLYMAFLREENKQNQIYLMRTQSPGGEAIQLTHHKPGVTSFTWAPNSQEIYFLADEPRSEADEKEYNNGLNAFAMDEGPNGQREAQWSNLWVIPILTAKESRLTQEKFLISDAKASPDAKYIALTARSENRRNNGYLSEIFLLNLQNKNLSRLTTNPIPESNILWSPDSQKLLFLAPGLERWENRNAKLFLLDINTKQIQPLAPTFEGLILAPGIFWHHDGKSFFFNARQGTDSHFFQLTLATGTYKPLTHSKGTLQVESMSKDNSRLVYSFSDYQTPLDIYGTELKTFKPFRLTDANPWVRTDIQLAEMQVLQWKSVKDFTIEGLLHLPAGYQKGTKLPLILFIHGGPAGSFYNEFTPQNHIYAGLGFAQLSPNVRGSDGYTDELRLGNTIDRQDSICNSDYQDLMKGVDKVIDEGYADPEQMGLSGWSYGGILGGWTITQTNRFKAASLGAGVYDWTSEYGPGFNFDVRLWHIGGTPWDNPEAYRQLSTLTHVKKITTPTLLLHGTADTTDTEAQSMMLFVALKDQGKTVRYVRFPGENHVFREPRHIRTLHAEEIGWLQKYVRNIHWQPEKRPEIKDKTPSNQ